MRYLRARGAGFLGAILFLVLAAAGCAKFSGGHTPLVSDQVPDWQSSDLDFFLNGSMSAEFIPERMLRASIAAFPDLFPGGNLSAFGVIEEAGKPWPVGFSRRQVPHLGSQIAVGINCASCHVGEVVSPEDQKKVLVLGKPSHFDVLAFLNAVIMSSFRTADPAMMEKFLVAYVQNPQGETLVRDTYAKQKVAIAEALKDDPFGAKGIAPGALHQIKSADLALDVASLKLGMNLVPTVKAIQRIFHNLRVALHIPEKPVPPPASIPGPGRTEAFGVLAAAFFGHPTKFDAPVKYGVVWELAERKWVHWDLNDSDPLARNLAAALGLGTPTNDNGAYVDFPLLKRQTELSEVIRAPRYPFAIDAESAARGKPLYDAQCASCHDGAQNDDGEKRLFTPAQVGTDANRARFMNEKMATAFNAWTQSLKIPGYEPKKTAWRATGKYWASDLRGVWARAPYLHNGSVRTMEELLTAPDKRARTFRIGSRVYEMKAMGFRDEGSWVFDTRKTGNSRAGHTYGTALKATEKTDLIEYLKTL